MLKFHQLKVKSRSEVADDAVCITFEVPEPLREAYRFKAGQHVAVRLPLPGEDVRRTYSIVSPAGGGEDLCIGVRVQPGGRVSSWLAQQLEPGQSLEVLTPNGSFQPRIAPEHNKSYVAFAAGSGITPVLSIAGTVLAQEPRSRFTLFYGNRTTASTMFLEEVMALKNRYVDRFAVHLVMSREPQEIDLLNGRLDAGKVQELARVLFDAGSVDDYFVCGPGTMVEDVSTALRELGITGKIHTELFTTVDGTVSGSVGTITAPQRAAGPATQVEIVMDGRRRSFSMPLGSPYSVLDAAAHAGIELPYSCRAGVCSTCRTKVVRGEVRMEHNLALEDWEVEEGYVLCCQAHPLSEQLELSYDE